MAERIFATLECALLERRSWPTKAEARPALFTWNEGRCHPRRRHSALDSDAPINFGARYRQQARQRQTDEHGFRAVGA